MYCGKCFDLCHPKRGPLAEHKIGPPTVRPFKPKDDNTMCPAHPKEKLALHCFTCKSAICYLCKECGHHKLHHAELLDSVFRKTKVCFEVVVVADEGDDVDDDNDNVCS